MQHQSSKQLFEYWNQVRGKRLAPNRFEIEPARLAAILADVFILECRDVSTYCFRLAGTRICAALGHELRGQNLLDYWAGEDREAVQNLLHIVARDGAGALFEFESSDGDGEPAAFEMCVLPLVHTDNRVTRLLGSIAAVADPYWLGTIELRHLKLVSFDLVWPEMSPAVPEIADEPAVLAEASPQIAGDGQRRFRVLDGGLAKRSD